MQNPLLVLRKQARGDVLLCTPAIHALKRKSPSRMIMVQTMYPEILAYNPSVTAACETIQPEGMDVVNLEIAYESMPGWNLVDAFCHAAGFKMGTVARRLTMYPLGKDRAWAQQMRFSGAWVVAPGPGAWPGRNWSEENWTRVCKALLGLGESVILVGSCTTFSLPCTWDLRCETTVSQLAAVIGSARGFVGIDSFPAHVAGAMETPRVVLFGITTGKLILCDSQRTIAIDADPTHPFAGARHHVEKISSVKLGNPPSNPMDTITPDRVVAAILSS